MNERLSEKDQKKEIVKDIILKLHQGLSIEEAKDRFIKEVGSITSSEIADIEQALIHEGLPPEEIKKLCNVHVLLFESALKGATAKELSPAHPVYLFKQENREIERLTASLKDFIENKSGYEIGSWVEKIKDILLQLRGLDIHYTKKEQLLFPFLERYGFIGPSKVMWIKDDEIRTLLKTAFMKIGELDREEFIKVYLNPLIEEVEGMIFKEENILFPTSIEKLSVSDWMEILKESDEVGYAFIERPADTLSLIAELKRAVVEEPKMGEDHAISLPTGALTMKELMNLLNTLPVDITFIDKEDRVKYFSDSKDRIFVRPKTVIGRKVQNCHPPQSLEIVENILNSFKERKRNSVDFWIPYRGKFVYIRYFAVRDENGEYLGTLEVTQDIVDIKKLDGEKRLLDQGTST